MENLCWHRSSELATVSMQCGKGCEKGWNGVMNTWVLIHVVMKWMVGGRVGTYEVVEVIFVEPVLSVKRDWSKNEGRQLTCLDMINFAIEMGFGCVRFSTDKYGPPNVGGGEGGDWANYGLQ